MLLRRVYVIACIAILTPGWALADYAPSQNGPRTLTDAQRLDLARQFITKIKPNLQTMTDEEKAKRNRANVSNIPDGEELFFRLRLTQKISIDSQLLTTVQKGKLILSFTDFVNAVDFPIRFDPKTGTAEGFYIRENKRFSLDLAKREVTTDLGTFKMTDAVVAKDDDVFAPYEEMASWFNFKLEPNVAYLEFFLLSDKKLPIQEQIERREGIFTGDMDIPPASLPPLPGDEQTAFAVPTVDVSSLSSYAKPGAGGDAVTTQSSNVRTSGDFLYGNLLTQTQFTKEERLTNMRATYSKQSLAPELLGPLKARRYEVGDITPLDVPLSDNYTDGTGFRVTNRDPLRNIIGATTIITGNALPGWDVELYRDQQLLGLQTVGDDGTYTFPDVDLFGSDNTFRVVQYGLQGEIREEEIYIPVDNTRLADDGSAYDLALVRQDVNIYKKAKSFDDDDGAPALTALYELPIGNSSALTTGLVTRQDQGDQIATASAGVSTSLFDTLFNFDVGVENTGEMAAELITRKDIDKQQIRNETRVATEKFDVEDQTPVGNQAGAFVFQSSSASREIFGNEFRLNGPLDIGPGLKPRYNLSLDYSRNADAQNTINATAGFSTLFKPVSFNQQFVYSRSDSGADDTINSLTNLNGAFGVNRVRLSSDYEIKPDSELKRVAAAVNRRLSPTMDGEVGVARLMDSKLTEVSAQLNWDTGYGNVSPGIVYNSDNDLMATLTTRFGLSRDPLSGKAKLFDQNITNSGTVSAFVFLDKDGNNVFDKDDEAIPDAIIKAPQNGGREITDEQGYAYFSRMAELRLTDVFVDPDSLADPYWIPGYEGASVLPRSGHTATLQFPVHMSGEMDGTLYLKGKEEYSIGMKGVSLGLYDTDGEQVQKTKTEQDGYYIFSKIPPGTYYLVVDDTRLEKNQSRPLPQKVKIGYEGTTIYANNIYVKEGQTDVPLSVLAGELPYDAKKTEALKGRGYALNLGKYKSRLSMALAWFKIRASSGSVLEGTELIEAPAESSPIAKTGYVLRLSVMENNLHNAYKKCADIVRKGNACSLEILPGGLEEKVAAK